MTITLIGEVVVNERMDTNLQSKVSMHDRHYPVKMPPRQKFFFVKMAFYFYQKCCLITKNYN